MTPQAQALQPNLFELSGHGTHITYSTSGIDGRPRFSFRDAHFNENFTGDQIRTLDSELGTLVTVSLKRSVDRGYTSATLLVPGVTLGGQTSQHISTVCIVTVHITGIQPGHTGAQQTYNTVTLQGTAQLVEF